VKPPVPSLVTRWAAEPLDLLRELRELKPAVGHFSEATYATLAAATTTQLHPACETLDVCGSSKLLCIATSDTANKLGQTYADIKAALEKALTDADAQTEGDGFDFAPLTPLVKCP
jgi:hypothetical protein